MYNWHRTVLPRVLQIAEKDREYLAIWQCRYDIEAAFEKILGSLPSAERTLIEDYITHCEDMEYRKAQIAYQVGVRDGGQGRRCVRIGWLL